MQQAKEKIPSEFNLLCKERGLKITPQRTAVYNAIAGLTSHPSADEVYNLVIDKIPNISFDTVNRTLLTFSEQGLIDIIESPSGVRRFDPQVEQHHHLHCAQCGTIIDFTSSDYDNLSVPEELKKKFKVFKTRVSLTGICAECQKTK